MRHLLHVVMLVFLAASAWAAMPGSILITATKVKEGSREGGHIRSGKNVERKQDDLYYTFEIKSMSPANPSSVVVKWVVLASTVGGNLRIASQGEEEASLGTGAPTIVETPLFTLAEEKGPRGKKFEADVIGYGVRVLDEQGQVLSEKLDPASESKRLTEALDGPSNGGKKKRKNR